MAVISKQELQGNGNWWTWINYEGFNTFIVDTSTQISEADAVVLKNKYIDDHLYDTAPQAMINIYDNREILQNAIVFIKANNPNMTQWNAYLATQGWDNAYMIRWFMAMIARELASRNEITLGAYSEAEVLNRLKTWIINAPARRLEKILFGR